MIASEMWERIYIFHFDSMVLSEVPFSECNGSLSKRETEHQAGPI